MAVMDPTTRGKELLVNVLCFCFKNPILQSFLFFNIIITRGGHYMMMGGDVKGGQILGKYPAKLSDDGDEILERKRVIPTTSWDAIFQPIAAWAGVSPESLDSICPNIGNFPESDRFNAADVFENV